MIKKIAYIDCETTGLNSKKNSLIEIAIVIKESGKIIAQFQTYIKPFEKAIINKTAMKVNGLDIDEIRKVGEDPDKALIKIKKFLGRFMDKNKRADRYLFYSWGKGFDERFIREFFIQNKDRTYKKYFHKSVDLMGMFCRALERNKVKLKSRKLSYIAEYLKIDLREYKLHSALDDVLLMIDIENKIKQIGLF